MAITLENLSDWVVVEHGFDRDNIGHLSSIFSLSNGMLGVRAGPAEWPRGHATIFADAYVKSPLIYHEKFPGFANSSDTRAFGPGITAIDIEIDGHLIDFTTAVPLESRTELDLKTAALRHDTLWQLSESRKLRITTTHVVPLGAGGLLIQSVAITPENFAGTITLHFPLRMESDPKTDVDDPRISAQTRFHPICTSEADEGYVARFAAHGASLIALQRLPGQVSNKSLSVEASDNHTIKVDRLVVIGASGDELPLSILLDTVAGKGTDAVIAEHLAELERFWARANVVISGDTDLTRAMRYNLLQTYLSASRNAEFGTAAKGLSGAGYEGHSFWDTEAFVLPLLALIDPPLARKGLEWRISKLDQARANAAAIGHPRGALYPWRTIAGEECSAHYPTGSAQYHVNAGIAYALEVYLLATGDADIIENGGAAMLIETARLWFDVGHFSARRGGAFLIHGVTGPDEYTALVDNDFYTNAMARRHLAFAAKVVNTLAATDPQFFSQLSMDIGLTKEEPGNWLRAAENMWLPVDPATGVHPQDDTFMDKPLFAAAPTEPGDHRPLLMRVHPMILYRHRISKQGDVIQAHVSAGLDDSKAQLRRDFDYYEPLTTHDSTLSMTAFAIAAAWLGDDDRAKDYWRQTAFVDLDNLHGNTHHGLHLAAMAGSWLVMAQGYAGIRFDDEHLRLTPRCPEGIDSLKLRITWRGSLIEMSITPTYTAYQLLDGPPLVLFDHGREIMLGDQPVAIGRPKVEAVIFDLDGVLTDTAEAHYSAWQRLAQDNAIPFDRSINEDLKGIDRPNSLRRILAAAGTEVDPVTFESMLERKNAYYQTSIANFSRADAYPGVEKLLRECRQAGLKIGLASASRNAATLIEKLGIARWFDHVTDSATISRGKPDPEIFLATAEALGVAPENSIGIEDASAGIAAIRGAGMTALGVGKPEALPEADRVFPDIGSISLHDIIDRGGAEPLHW